MNTLVERELPLLEQPLSLRTQLLDVLTGADLGHALPGNRAVDTVRPCIPVPFGFQGGC